MRVPRRRPSAQATATLAVGAARDGGQRLDQPTEAKFTKRQSASEQQLCNGQCSSTVAPVVKLGFSATLRDRKRNDRTRCPVPEGQSEKTMRDVTENCRALKLGTYGFEEG
jgi:hypothetical protein